MLVLVLTLATQAMAGEAPQVDPARSRIINGNAVNATGFPSAAAIGFDAPGIGRQATCSASLIGTRMLLTAAHCTAEFESQYGLQPEQIIAFGAAFFGTNVNTGEVEAYAFADFYNHPKYGGSQLPENDIGVIILEEDVPYQTTWFAQQTQKRAAIGETVVSVGYGSTVGYNQGTSGEKRRVQMVVDQVDEQFLTSFAQTNPTNGNVCSGDSGGPQYHRNPNGTLEQWGVHSNVFGSARPCLTASNSTNVGTFADWILNRIDDEYGTTDRCAVMGIYNDGVCDTDCIEPDVDCQIDTDGDGLVSDDEFGRADLDEDGVVSLDEAESFSATGCSHTGANPFGLAVLGLAGLALRRRD